MTFVIFVENLSGNILTKESNRFLPITKRGVSLKRRVKKIITSSELAHRVYCEIKFAEQKLRINREEKAAKEFATSVYSISDLPKNKSASQEVCHIIGSGWSVAESAIMTQRNDCYVIGFNFACLSGLKFDAYFVEFGGPSCHDIAEQQKKSLDAFRSNQNGFVFFKNIWDNKNDIRYAADIYGNEVTFIRDICVPCFHEKFLSQSARLFLTRDQAYLRQYKSSALTSVNFARYLGFKDIVLHGIDFGGGYFFDLPEYSDVAELTPPRANTLAYNQGSRAARHPTAIDKTGIDRIIPIIAKQLRGEGVRLYAASPQSPLSAMLPVFDAVTEDV